MKIYKLQLSFVIPYKSFFVEQIPHRVLAGLTAAQVCVIHIVMSVRSCLSRFSPVGVAALALLPLAVWSCARFWWFSTASLGEYEGGDLDVFCKLMPPLLTQTAALFTFFMLPPWRARQRGAGAWFRRAAAFAVSAAGALAAEFQTCCCTAGYDAWIAPLLVLSLIGAWMSLLTALLLSLSAAAAHRRAEADNEQGAEE